jgi:hypothetical protein
MAFLAKSLRLGATVSLCASLLASPAISQSQSQGTQTAPATTELPLSLADAVFDYFRPKIRPRALNPQEKSEISRLSAQFVGMPNKEARYRDITSYYRDYGRASDLAAGPHSALLRLMELGESGDREAMIAARDALAFGWGKGPMFAALNQGSQATIRMSDVMSDGLRLALVGYWTAQIWHRFGPERGLGAEIGMRACLLPFKNFFDASWRGDYKPDERIATRAKTFVADCGFSIRYPGSFRKAGSSQRSWEKDGRNNAYFSTLGDLIGNWVRVGGQPDFQISEFRATIGDPAFELLRYRNLLEGVGYLEPNLKGESGYKLTEGEWAWVNDYRARTGETYHWGNALYSMRQIANFAEYRRAKEAKELAEARQRRPDFETDSERRSRRRFEWDQALRSGTMFTGQLPSAGVTVRNYDRNGNYLGSTVTTRGEAELSGAKPR